MSVSTLALINLGIALLIIGLSLPLIRRKVPMNHFYGVRFPQSFRSDAAWYAINEYGGRALLLWSLPNLFLNLLALSVPLTVSQSAFATGSSVLLALTMMAACIQSYFYARKIGRNTSH